MSLAFYNEHDPFAAAWLRELIAAGLIAPGVVDERSIEDVRPDELSGYAQCHFFAGIGIWSLALRRAGWPDDRPIWTGSCPCQPFSTAGKGKGFADERHLWPAFFHLIEQCEPAIVAGEQVAGGGVGAWFDLVQADLEAMGYAFGIVPLAAAGFEAAHIRDRAFWVAHASGAGLEGTPGRWSNGPQWAGPSTQRNRRAGGLAHADGHGTGHITGEGLGTQAAVDRENGGVSGQRLWAGLEGAPVGLGHNSRASAPMLGRQPVDWLFCRDATWRPVEAGTFPLAHENPARVGRLRGYGNAIDAETLTQFIIAVDACIADRLAA